MATEESYVLSAEFIKNHKSEINWERIDFPSTEHLTIADWVKISKSK